MGFTSSCNNKPGESHAASIKFDQYFVKGELLYTAKCSNCHQKNGTGLGRVYPPLDKSDFVDNRLQDVLCLMRNGIKGELMVNGQAFNQAMPPPLLTDLEIAELSTYLYNHWGRQKGIIQVSEVSLRMIDCKQDSVR